MCGCRLIAARRVATRAAKVQSLLLAATIKLLRNRRLRTLLAACVVRMPNVPNIKVMAFHVDAPTAVAGDYRPSGRRNFRKWMMAEMTAGEPDASTTEGEHHRKSINDATADSRSSELIRCWILLGHQPGWNSSRLPRAIDAGDHRSASCQQLLVAPHLVMMLDPGPFGSRNARAQREQIVERSGQEVLATNLYYHQHVTGLFHLPVAHAGGPQKLGPPQFEVREIVRVMQSALTVGFLISNSNLRFVVREHSI